jgi:tellurite resistance protein
MLQNPDPQTLDAIGLLFLVCSHGVDATLEEPERDLIAGKVAGRLAAVTERTVYEAVRRALVIYKDPTTQADLPAKIRVTAAMLASAMSKPDQQQLLQDLCDVAQADGAVSDPERQFVTEVARAFGLPVP